MKKTIPLIILFLTILSFCINSCRKERISKKLINQESIKIMRDSVSTWLMEFIKTKDSISLSKALSLNNKIIEYGISDDSLFYDYNIRIQLLSLSQQYKKAFLLKDKIIEKDNENIDRIIYKAQYYNFINQSDSSDLYFILAIKKYDSLIRKNYDFDLIIKRLEIFMYQNQKMEGFNYIDSLRKAKPKSENWDLLKENFNEWYKYSTDLFKKTHNDFNN